jgi:hypothetical protein
MSNQSQGGSFFWPPIADLKAAQAVGRQGAVMCVLIVMMTTVMAIVTHSIESEGAVPTTIVTPVVAIVVLLVYGTLATMIYRMSRVAAVLALILYLGNFLNTIVQQGISASLIVQILVFFTFLNSVRGTFTYHRLRHQRQEAMQEEAEAVL